MKRRPPDTRLLLGEGLGKAGEGCGDYSLEMTCRSLGGAAETTPGRRPAGEIVENLHEDSGKSSTPDTMRTHPKKVIGTLYKEYLYPRKSSAHYTTST